MLTLSDNVAAALAAGEAVVALESTIITHGMPYPENRDTALAVEQVVRDAGAVPATIAVVDGRPRIGLDADGIERLAAEQTIKLSRRDLAAACAAGLSGGTTVAATMLLARRAGIRVFATGGIGGVHRDYTASMDVSADLSELGRCRVAVVCAGIKSILDLPRTMEYLETAGVPVLGYRCDELPAFYSRDSGLGVDYRMDSDADIARLLHAQDALDIDSGELIVNPVAEDAAIPFAAMEELISDALNDMAARGISGKAATPFLLARLAETSGGQSLATNIALIRSNARVAAGIALAYAAA